MRGDNHGTRARFSSAALAVLATLVACSTDPKDPDIAVTIAAQVEALGGGTVPLPIRELAGPPQLAWNGSYAELLAMDAWAVCSLTQKLGPAPDHFRQGELFFSLLRARHAEATGGLAGLGNLCGEIEPTDPEQDYYLQQWLLDRQNPECNIDPITREPHGLNVELEPTNEPTYVLPSTMDLGLTGDFAERARIEAQDQVQYAFLNLCIAKRMQEHLQSPEVMLASREVLLEITRVVRERALSAVFQMSLIAKAFGLAEEPAEIDNPHKIVPVLIAWRDWLAADDPMTMQGYPSRLAKLSELGRDFALAISTFVDASLDHTQRLLRTPDAHKTAGFYRPVTGFDQQQRRILAGPRVFTAVEGFGPFGEMLPKAVAVDMSAPEIGVLLGIARDADALRISASESSIDIAQNAQALLDAVEEHIRQLDCDAEEDETPGCAEIPMALAQDAYRVFQRFNIQRVHAHTLIRALVEHVFGQPTAAGFNPTDGIWQYDSLDIPSDVTKRLLGNNVYSGDFNAPGGGQLALDPEFTVSMGARMFQDQTWTYLPPRVMDQDVHPMEQGLRFRSLWAIRLDALGESSGPTAESIMQLHRPVGSVPVLAAAREALLTLDASASGLFEAARPGLNLLDQVIGKHSVLFRRAVSDQISEEPLQCNFLWSYDADGDPETPELVFPETCHRLVPTNQMDGDAEYTIDVITSGEDISSTHVRRTLLPATDSGCEMGCPLDAFTDAENTSLTSLSAPFLGTQYKILQGVVAVPPDRGVDISLTIPADPENPVRSVFRGVLDASTWVDRATGEQLSNAWRNEQFYIIPQPPLTIGTDWALGAFGALNTNFGRVTSIGGDLGVELDRAWLVQRADWSKPQFDALGLRLDFAPMGDAALYGGPHGENAYRYFLQRAGEAADEATFALQGAIDTLIAESEDRLRLTTEEVRGREIPALEMKALCGEQGPCDVGSELVLLNVLPCRDSVFDLCAAARGLIERITGSGALLAAPVAEQLNNSRPDFNRFAGGELERLFVGQWNAWKELQSVVLTTVLVGQSATDQLGATHAENAAAQREFELVDAEIGLAYTELPASEAEIKAQQTIYEMQAAEYVAQLDLAKKNMDTWCDPGLLAEARENGFSYSGQSLSYGPWSRLLCQGEFLARKAAEIWGAHFGGAVGDCYNVFCGEDEMCGATSRSFSEGSGQAAQDRCAAARNEYEQRRVSVQGPPNPFDNPNTPRGLARALRDLAEALQQKLNLHDLKFEALQQRLPAAMARREAAFARSAATASNAAAQVIAQGMAVQAAWSKVLDSAAAIQHAQEQAKLRVARLELENELATREIKARFGLRRQFRSFDLWRARALSENARRLAATARRAIEARFVVDLSEMSSPEPFVDAPSLWADEIYDSDLKPPTSLGRTAGPNAQGGAIYLNKLVDYVNNLELFVNGYGLQRPRASVQVDTEVLQLPAPAPVSSVLAVDGTPYAAIDVESVGWSFFCDASNAWIRHPNVAEFNIASFDLSTACHGQPPSLARLGFWLDPWGRVNRHLAERPFSERHNVRWRSLGINLAGSGVRDCSAAPDPLACYAEPFIRYDLRHVGPAWVTNHEEAWRTVQVPTAIIEGGKALAAEEWVDPVSNGFNAPVVASVAREELAGRPVGGAYELTLRLSPDVRVERIQRIQLLMQTEYWVRQEAGDEAEVDAPLVTCGNGIIEPPETCEYGSADAGITLCPSSVADCDDGNPCTVDRLLGSPLLCTAECQNEPIVECANADGCCPIGCNFATDKDCSMELCGAGTLECDGDQLNGCESLSSAEHCSACDTACNASFDNVALASCATGVCQISCETGFEDCDDEYSTGCETNVFDVNNCGGCAGLGQNDVCTGIPRATTSCPTGMCQIDACDSGYLDCNEEVADGCEIQNTSCWPASNFDPDGYNFAGAPVTVLDCGTTTVNTTDPDGGGAEIVTFTNWCGTTPPVLVQAQSGGSDAVVLLMNGLTVSTGATLRLIGNRPIILAVNGDVTIDGTVDASSNASDMGAGANLSCTPAPGSGAGSNGSGSSSTGGGGGGGGGFGTAGGNGGDGNGNNNNGVGGAVRGNATLIPLAGGCPGGNGGGASGSNGIGGAGGGAVEISAAGTLTVSSTGIVRANGEAGTLGTSSEGGGGGGGSGGAVLLEAGDLAISGTVNANGGAGGNGRGGTAGAAGSTSSGSAGSTAANESSNGGGGGGGGYGRIVQQDLLIPE